MGSSASKASRAVGSAARQYPTRPPPTSQTASPATSSRPPPPAQRKGPGPTVKPQPQASASRSEAINLDASDPDFARSLRSIGPVQPSPTVSHSSTAQSNQSRPVRAARSGVPDPRSNPAIAILDARSKLQDEAEKEFMEAGRRGHEGRQFLDIYTVRQILILRDERGKTTAEIEKALGLKKGVVERLGAKGVVGLAQETGRAQKAVDIV